MNIAVLCPSEIALRRFMPALRQVPELTYVGVGVASAEERLMGLKSAENDIEDDGVNLQKAKAQQFVEEFGGRVFDGYNALIDDPSVDTVYIPLPPGLHYLWAKRALEAGKHVMLEKPFTTSLHDTGNLIDTARANNLAVHENYMFAFHSQIDYVRETLASDMLGEIRLIRIDFGFPFRGVADFRYSKGLGGGALFDCGGYTLKLASLLLGPSTRLVTAAAFPARDLEVDVFGSATLQNDDGLVAQVSFGMDNDYRCNIDVWGSGSSLFSGRILTAPVGFEPTFEIGRNGERQTASLPADDSFKKSIEHFCACVQNVEVRESRMQEIALQAKLVDDFKELAELKE